MRTWIKNRMAIAVIALLLTACLLSVCGAALAQGDTNTGIKGLKGPTFTVGVILGAGSGGGGSQYDGYPWAITGYVMSKSPGSVHVWVSSCSQAVLDLGFKPGDIVTILCSENQIEDLNSGDWVQITGFVANGKLAYSGQVVLPSPFSY